MDTLPSIINNPSSTTNRLPPLPTDSIPPIPNSSIISNITSTRNNPLDEKPTLFRSRNIEVLMDEKEKVISTLRDTNINLAQMVFDMNDKLMETNTKINTEISRSIEIQVDDNELEQLKSSNTSLKHEIIDLKGQIKELHGSYHHLNRVFVHNISKKDTRNLVSPTSYNRVKQDYESLKEKLTCRICFDNKINTIVEPCNHTVMCMECVNNMRIHTLNTTKCPICNVVITGCKRIYLPL